MASSMLLEVEYVPNGDCAGWWCHVDPDGVGAIAGGLTPWLAIASALGAIPEAEARNARMTAYLDDLLSGNIACRDCGKPIAPPPPGGMCSLTQCEACCRG